MSRKIIAIVVALGALAVSACGGRFGGGTGPMGGAMGNTQVLPPLDSDLAWYATMPKDSIGEELPREGLGTVRSTHWKVFVGGFTQKSYSQVLGFPPGTKITLHNLSKSVTHTLDVVKEISGPPARFPKAPKLPVTAHGHGKLGVGYASGPIKPGKTVTILLDTPGHYIIGCAFHYGEGMRDVLVVAKGATPGPQATPMPSPSGRPTSSPTPRSSYDP